MSNISFNEQIGKTRTPLTKRTWADKLIATGLVKTKSQANTVLIIIALIGIGITIYNVSTLQRDNTTTGTPELVVPS
jgi:hypothetical protein